ncbi:hypothetical protein PORY_002193 [Pneumocystis oryctolagi]|uniref:Uncharacterized protein n=1 Tax=Pneumocystis oryctolagi TaxID=42067 RepID=A0ACB7CAA2_9ASCO|nr:hypothetical protein PORY_002193 [Pneumocystis oryctolagi]
MDELSELERLEQKITLTLYEIDANFNKCHRIVTTEILPIIERYAEHSRRVWEGSKFWKQFFETSANVSLSGYEELSQDDATPEKEEDESTNAVQAPATALEQPVDTSIVTNDASDVVWMSTPLDMSTPRPTLPIDALYASDTPNTVRIGHSSPFTHAKKENPLLHRVLDTSWRLQALPHLPLTSRKCASNVLETLDTSSPLQPVFNTRDEEEDDLDASLPAGLSPPVTLQFSLPPSKLLKTPVQEAARYVVDDILRTAGADISTARRNLFGNMSDSPLMPSESHGTLPEWDISSEG